MSTPTDSGGDSSDSAIKNDRDQEQRAVIDRIIAAPSFTGAPKLIPLLKYLFEHRGTLVREQDIAREVYGIADYSGAKVRKAVKELSKKLITYAATDISANRWCCLIKPVQGLEGYRLEMISLLQATGAVHGFWQTHLEPMRPVTIVCNDPDFYRDKAADILVRVSHMDAPDMPLHQPVTLDGTLLHEKVSERLFPCHPYTLSGEIGARDHIARWFSEEMGIRTEMKFSRRLHDISDLAEHSPILLGNGRTNKLIRAIRENRQYPSSFGYFVDAKPYGTVRVKGFREQEAQALRQFAPEKSDGDLILRDDPRQDNIAFGVVTRLPNPHDGEGTITILSAGFPKVLEEIAYTLTNERRLLELLEQISWPRHSLIPRYFEALFSVGLQDDIDARPEKPRLHCLRHFERLADAERPIVIPVLD